MTDLNKEGKVNLSFEQDNGAVWVFADDSQFGTEISHLMMMHVDEYNEDELRVICHHAACEIDRLRAELEKAKAQAVPDTHIVVPKESLKEALAWCGTYIGEEWRGEIIETADKHYDILENILKASESGAEV
ncbi:hypothetical protein [Acinetobacter baumannii]|uniref:hypothetical protein n=1 Tax=Acinetobacter baumannii TaxID=470 RepID=UPI0023422824|nr:hypothetical protein [Acinetobacter baumannii]MDC4146526.1 hypothetical protein [Acinetobacter baumannii]